MQKVNKESIIRKCEGIVRSCYLSIEKLLLYSFILFFYLMRIKTVGNKLAITPELTTLVGAKTCPKIIEGKRGVV
jgi:hypothetical protein